MAPIIALHTLVVLFLLHFMMHPPRCILSRSIRFIKQFSRTFHRALRRNSGLTLFSAFLQLDAPPHLALMKNFPARALVRRFPYFRAFSPVLLLLLWYFLLANLSQGAPEDFSSLPSSSPRFVMYNVRNYFVDKDAPRSPYPRPIKRIAEREAVADTLASVHPQVIGLVEIGGRAALDDLAERLARRNLYFPHRFVLERRGEDRALGILSRFPILHNNSNANSKLVGERTNRRMLRGILDVTLCGYNNQCWRIVGVHLKSRKTDNPSAADTQRSREVKTLAAHLQYALLHDNKTPFLVFGDWNTGIHDPILLSLTQPADRTFALHRIKATDAHGDPWTIYYAPNREYNTFDHIYVNSTFLDLSGKGMESGVIEKTPHGAGSDHRAVWCSLP